MRHCLAHAVFALVPLFAACSSAPESEGASASDVTVKRDDSRADSGCQIVLRHTSLQFSSNGPATDCSSGTCWVVVTVTFDVAMNESLAGSDAYVWYQGKSGTWRASNLAQPIDGAPIGFRRYQVALDDDTFLNANGANALSLVPYLVPAGGTDRVFDHNRVGDPSGAYVLDVSNNWTIGDDAAACPGTAPTGTFTATFATGWKNSSSGALTAGGKLDVDYDVYRLPATLSCTTDGVNAFATVAYARFEPGGQTVSERVDGPRDASYRVTSVPLEFDVPSDATRASLWFYTSSDCTAPAWDSNYGANYVFAVAR